MRLLPVVVACATILPALGCRIEDRTPAGSRRDEEAVLALIAEYGRGLSEEDWSGVRTLFWRNASYSGPMVPRSVGQAVPVDSALAHLARSVDDTGPETFDVRVLRTDFRQDGDIAAAWVTTRRRAPLPGSGAVVERDWIEHLVLRRIGDTWRIVSVAGATVPRGGTRVR